MTPLRQLSTARLSRQSVRWQGASQRQQSLAMGSSSRCWVVLPPLMLWQRQDQHCLLRPGLHLLGHCAGAWKAMGTVAAMMRWWSLTATDPRVASRCGPSCIWMQRWHALANGHERLRFGAMCTILA